VDRIVQDEAAEPRSRSHSANSGRYPLVIVDEYQDTNLDQWRVIQALAKGSTIICLADPDQRIYEGFIPGVDEERLQRLNLGPPRQNTSSPRRRPPRQADFRFGTQGRSGRSTVDDNDVGRLMPLLKSSD
jgi:UvrD/REP helicase N-terminal domain